MSSIEQKRAYVANLYPNQVWKNRVEKMEDVQIIAIYLSERPSDKPQTKKPDHEQTRLF